MAVIGVPGGGNSLGNSARGKTTLVQIIGDYLSGRTGLGTEIIRDKRWVVLSGEEAAILRLQMLMASVVFVDEQERFLYSKVFVEAVLSSGCYFVFVTRDGLVIIKIPNRCIILCIRYIRKLV